MQTDTVTPMSEMPSEEMVAAGGIFLLLYVAILVVFCVGC